MYETLRLGSYISSFLGYLLFFLYFEKAFKNTKYIPALISLSTIVTIVFFIDINEILTYINVIIVILILYWFYKNSSKEFQIITIFFYLGMIVIIVGGLFNWRRFREIYAIPPTYGYFVTILGVIMITIPLLIEPEKFTRSKILKPVNVWILILIIMSTLLPLSILTLINTEVSSQLDAFIMIVSTIFVCIILIMISLRNIRKHMKKEEIPKTEADSPDLMKIFTKPQKLTEEEVSISKEKKVCLVCKGGVTRYDTISALNVTRFIIKSALKLSKDWRTRAGRVKLRSTSPNRLNWIKKKKRKSK